MLYPLKFNTIFKEKIWGGQKIKTVLNKDFGELSNCGETWEISAIKNNVSVVSNGTFKGKSLTDLIHTFGTDLLGIKVFKTFKGEFPLLIKFIDANDDLSIQVHPNDVLAKKKHNSSGKTEMWYVIQADKDASLISGFNRELSKEEYLNFINSGNLVRILNKENVENDDVIFIPAGRIHTIGKGNLIAEIQQTSDITYRIHDFDRIDCNGKKRDLHFKESLDALDFNFYSEYKLNYDKDTVGLVELIDCSYFKTQKLNLKKNFHRDLSKIDSFVIYIILDGAGKIEYNNYSIPFCKGECILIPASMRDINIIPLSSSKILETYIPNIF